MRRRPLLNLLHAFSLSPHCSQEERDALKRFRDFVEQEPLCFERKPNPCHITGSALVLSHDKSQVLLMLHRKIDMWLQFGGHADGDPDIKAVALKEAYEESGIEGLSFLSEEPVDIDIHDLPAHVPCQTHFDLRFLLIAPKDAVFVQNNESKSLAWFSYEEALACVQTKGTKRLIKKAGTFYRL